MASPFCFLISELPTIWKLAFRPKMLGILITIKLVKTGETSQSIYKGVIIADLLIRPSHLSQGRHTRQGLIFHHTFSKDILRPDISLNTQDMLTDLHRNAVWSWIECINFLYWDKTIATRGFEDTLLRLEIVEIAIGGR